MTERIVGEICRRLRLEERAKRDATNGVPMGGVIPDIENAAKGIGREMLADIETHCREAEANTRNLHKELQDAAAELDSPNYGVTDVEVARKKRDGAEANYNTFKHDNNIARDASGDDRLEQIGWAATIVIAEGALNSYFFAPVVEGGLLDGFFIAFFISLINVACAFIGGSWGLRYGIYHCKPHLKAGGLLIFLSGAAMCAVVVVSSSFLRANVGLLEGRDDIDISKLLDMAWALSLEDWRQMNWGRLVSSLHSFLLVFVGALCAFFGFWKGLAFDDSYPGFGKMHRLREQAQEEYTDAQNEWRKNKNDTLKKIMGVEGEYLKARTAVDAANNKAKDAVDLPADIRRDAQASLNRYHGIYQTISPVSHPAPESITDAPFGTLAGECRKHAKAAEEIEYRFKDAEKSYFRMRDRIERQLLGAGGAE